MQQSQRGGKTSKQPKTGAKPTEPKSGNDDQAEDTCSKEPSQNAIIEHISQLSKEWRRDFTVFKNEVLQTMKDDLAEFKDEVLKELQAQNANITSAQTRKAELEAVCMALRDTLLTTIQLNVDTRDKMVDLESRSRRNNLRIYGVPEGKEGKAVIEFVTQLLTEQLELSGGFCIKGARAPPLRLKIPSNLHHIIITSIEKPYHLFPIKTHSAAHSESTFNMTLFAIR